MTDFNSIVSNDFFESVLPTVGSTKRIHVPVWDEGQKMFIFDQYDNGNHYYRGARFCDNLAIIEKVGQSHSWSYIDSIELYAYNGHTLELIQKTDYDKTFRNEYFVRSEAERMICNYLRGALKASGQQMSEEQITSRAHDYAERSYKSFLSSDYNRNLLRLLSSL